LLDFRFWTPEKWLNHSPYEQGVRPVRTRLKEGFMIGTVFAMSDIDDRDYDTWLDTMTEASARFDALQTAVSEVRYLCDSRGVSSEQILKVLDWHGV
jgi:hypothetical protein